jgi:hypothetical protein
VKTQRLTLGSADRRGVIAPLVAVALVVIMAGVALVLDRLWLAMAREELRGAAQSAALAAAAKLVDDGLLRSGAPVGNRPGAARLAASRVAPRNLVAGRPVQLDAAVGADVRIGVLATNAATGALTFLESDHNANTAMVLAQNTRYRRNPIALLAGGLTGQLFGDVVALAGATVDNHVIGLRPLPGANAPALPLGILYNDPTGKRTDTWAMQIDQRKGPDLFRYDPLTGLISSGPDGIPEILLTSADLGQGPDSTNVTLIELQHAGGVSSIPSQIAQGWAQSDLEEFGGELSPGVGPSQFTAKGTVTGDSAAALGQVLGECRVCLLYDGFSVGSSSGWGTLQCRGFVAGRIMQIRRGTGEVRQIVFQPGVLVTRTAVLASAPGTAGGPTNQYVYKLTLTQ